ncbi:hypothetical protein ACQKLM_03110 [Bacillus thuringiensis]|uniref:hypothetical protein n=1 Tax=Bacillus thuringiensis TaxID=1428 RepID=UPI003D021D53
MELSGNEKVAIVIGEEMNKVYTNILQRLSNPNEHGFMNDLGNGDIQITQDDLIEFFKKLGGGEMNLDFHSIEEKGIVKKYFSNEIKPESQFFGADVSVSIGISVRC